MTDINSIGVIGGGVMGSGIAQALAVGGARVTVRDLNEQLIEKSRSTIVDGRYGLKRGVERGKTTQKDADASLARLSFTTSLGDLKDADLIIEAVPEDLELKKKVFGELDTVAGPETIFATNTSGLAISDINKAVSEERRQRFIGMDGVGPGAGVERGRVVKGPEA